MFQNNVIIDSERFCQDLSNGVWQNTEILSILNCHSSKIFLHNVIIDSETPCQDLSNGACQNTAERLVVAQWVKKDKNKFTFNSRIFKVPRCFCTMRILILKVLPRPFQRCMLERGRMPSFCTMGQKYKNKFSFQFQDFHSFKIFLHNVIIDSERPCQNLSSGVCQNTGEFLAFAQWVKKIKQIYLLIPRFSQFQDVFAQCNY